uniref:aminotransferase class IV n=1 Tax=Candidatus Scatousia sp. TaxID=3085663 RepID=UPI004025D744
KFYTPPLKCGLLNGVLRQNLLDSNVCVEKVLYKEDLLNANSIYCINSVRGIKRVEL